MLAFPQFITRGFVYLFHADQKVFRVTVLILAIILTTMLSIFHFFDFSDPVESDKNSLWHNVERDWDVVYAIEGINQVISIFKMNHGYLPESIAQLVDGDHIRLDKDLLEDWEFSLETEDDGKLFIIAASTENNGIGAGKEIVFDRRSGKFIE